MSPRKALFGLMGVIGLSGSAAAEPPVNPLVEGCEPNPVAREFYQPETPIGGYVAGPDASERPNAGAWLVLTAVLWDVLLDRLTVPLGTAVLPDPDGAGAV
jgi:hypothetical protein